MRWLKKLFRRILPRYREQDIQWWEDWFRQQLKLRESQEKARESLGINWKCHKANGSKRIERKPPHCLTRFEIMLEPPTLWSAA